MMKKPVVKKASRDGLALRSVAAELALRMPRPTSLHYSGAAYPNQNQLPTVASAAQIIADAKAFEAYLRGTA